MMTEPSTSTSALPGPDDHDAWEADLDANAAQAQAAKERFPPGAPLLVSGAVAGLALMTAAAASSNKGQLTSLLVAFISVVFTLTYTAVRVGLILLLDQSSSWERPKAALVVTPILGALLGGGGLVLWVGSWF